jgi:mannose-6-phosphate isomerase-like protein (cupin superfamily)
MSETTWNFPLKEIQEIVAAQPENERFHYLLRHGSMMIGLYAPVGIDDQTPHKQDELYIIVSGQGEFVKGDTRIRFAPQDVLFVEAGMPHRFENYSPDFQTWVIFWGPAGGE